MNQKADALSWQYDTSDTEEQPSPILSPSCFVGPMIWTLDELILAVNHQHALPLNCPAGKVYHHQLNGMAPPMGGKYHECQKQSYLPPLSFPMGV